jgi:hypothetical protein
MAEALDFIVGRNVLVEWAHRPHCFRHSLDSWTESNFRLLSLSNGLAHILDVKTEEEAWVPLNCIYSLTVPKT